MRGFKQIEAEKSLNLVVDLDRVRFIDLKALETLIAASFRARESGRTLVVHDAAGVAARVIALTGVESILVLDRPQP